MAWRIGTQHMLGGKDTFNPSPATPLPSVDGWSPPCPLRRGSLWRGAEAAAFPPPPKAPGPWLLLQLTSERCWEPWSSSARQALGREQLQFYPLQVPCSPSSPQVSAEVAALQEKPGHPVNPETGWQPPLGGAFHSSPLHLGHLSLPKQVEVQACSRHGSQRWG